MMSNSIFKDVLFATDFSKTSNEILRNLTNLGIERVVLVHVIDVNSVVGIRKGFDIEEWIYSEIMVAGRRLSSMVEFLEGKGIEAKFVCPIPIGDPATEIVNTAKRENVSAIVLGARGRSVNKDILLGSVAEGVLRKSQIPVLIVKNPKLKLCKILFVYDISENARNVLDSLSCEIIIVYVGRCDSIVRSELRSMRNGNIAKIVVGKGNPPEEILKCATEENIDAIVLCGLGVTSDSVIRYSDVSVIYFPNSPLIPGSI